MHTTAMVPIIRFIVGLRFLFTLALGNPLPHASIPEYFQDAPVTRGQISVSQVQQELGPQMSRGSLIIGPDDPAWANVTKRYSTFSKPQDLRLVVKVNAETDVARVVCTPSYPPPPLDKARTSSSQS
jgi:hypothetical protein